jgi:hypothetical protein
MMEVYNIMDKRSTVASALDTRRLGNAKWCTPEHLLATCLTSFSAQKYYGVGV